MTETIKWQQGAEVLTAFDKEISCRCDVRNGLNYRRKADQVVYTIPDKEPYQPRIFPKGTWVVGTPLERTDSYLAPFYIPTNAWQPVNVWEVKNGLYVKKTDKTVADKAYGLHHSTSNTTLGCIKIMNLQDLLWLANMVAETIKNGNGVWFEVS